MRTSPSTLNTIPIPRSATPRRPEGWLIATLAVLALSSSAYAGPNVPVPRGAIEEIEVEGNSARQHLRALTDRDIATAWTGPEDLAAPTLNVVFKAPRFIGSVTIAPGAVRSHRAFRRSTRPARVTLRWDGGANTYEVPDRRGTHRIHLPGIVRTDWMTLTVEATHGDDGQGVSISELGFLEPRAVRRLPLSQRGTLHEDVQAVLTQPTPETRERVVRHGRRVLPWLEHPIAHGDSDHAATALETLVAMDTSRTSRVLRALLEDRDVQRAALALRVIDAPPSARFIPHLVRLSRAQDPAIASLALDLLAQSHDDTALPRLEAALRGDAVGPRAVATSRLSDYGHAGLEVIHRALRRTETPARLAALAALSGYGDTDDPDQRDRAVSLARAHVSDDDTRVRLAAVQVLGILPGAEAIRTLTDVISGPRSRARTAAIDAIVAQARRAVGYLQDLIPRLDADTRSRILVRLGQVDDGQVRELLVEETLRADFHPWKEEAESALVAHGTDGVTAMLNALEAHPALARRAARYLERMGAQSGSLIGARTVQLPPERGLDTLRVVLVRALHRAYDNTGGTVVANLYQDPISSKKVRLACLEAMGHLPTSTTRAIVLRELDHEDPMLSATALGAAGAMGERRAVPKILNTLQQTPSRLWSPAAVGTLGALKAHEAMPLLRSQFGLASHPVKVAILRAAQQIGDRVAARLLVEASVGVDEGLSREANLLLTM